MSTTSNRQLTVRAVIAGMLLGGFMSLSNLYVALKTGWSIGVSITAGILAFAIFAGLVKSKLVKEEFGILENNAMQSVASAAGYMTGGGTVAAIPALMMITGEVMPGWQMFFWISSIAMLGVVMAIPMKQQMIDIEGLRFPSGVAAAETLKALHGGGAEANKKAQWLMGAGAIGAVVGFFRDVHEMRWPLGFVKDPESVLGWTLQTESLGLPWKYALRGQLPIYLKLHGRWLSDFTIGFEGSLIMLGAGAIMGFRSAWSMVLGAFINYVVLAPYLYDAGIIDPKLGYRRIVAWSVWFGSSMILTSGLLAFAFQWRTVVRAISSVGASFRGAAGDDGQVPMSWFFMGVMIFAPCVVFLEWWFFGIALWMGLISVVMSFFIALVACRATGETDTTPTGALGKITQITFGALDPGNVTTNLMTANAVGGVALHSADLLTDLKSGYLLGADPKQQFWAQFFGVTAGSVFVVPAYRLLIPDASVLGGEKWPAPGAQTWKSVAELLAKGFDQLPEYAPEALIVGAVLGVVIVVLERAFPKAKPYIPSATGLGLAFTTPGYNSISMFLGACIALGLERNNKKLADETIVPVSSGFIAGESLIGVAIAALVVAGLLGG
jgi:uncharacterized oligopeptide transporter (OPT) family protein